MGSSGKDLIKHEQNTDMKFAETGAGKRDLELRRRIAAMKIEVRKELAVCRDRIAK